MLEEIQQYITEGNKWFWTPHQLIKSKVLSHQSKIKIYKTIIRSVVTYACETLPVNATEALKRLEEKVFRLCRDEITSQYRIRSIELAEMYWNSNIVQEIKSCWSRWADTPKNSKTTGLSHCARRHRKVWSYRVVSKSHIMILRIFDYNILF